MSTVNKAIVVGHVGQNPDIRTTQAGAKVASFSIATSEKWTDKATGERKEKTEWHRIVVFNEGLVKVIESYVKKGAKLYVEGAMATRKWSDNAGIERYTTEVVLGPYRGQLVLLDKREGAPPPAESADAYGAGGKPDINDEISF